MIVFPLSVDPEFLPQRHPGSHGRAGMGIIAEFFVLSVSVTLWLIPIDNPSTPDGETSQ